MRAPGEAGPPAPSAAAAGPGPLGDRVALLAAFSLFLSAIEWMIPKPLPFMRLGISNLPLVLAVELLPFPQYLALALLKTVGQALITGTLASYVFLFSLAGTLASALLMYGARRAGGRFIGFIGVSVLGALASNLVQLVMAWLVMFGDAAWLVGPPFLVMGLVTGLLLGLFCERFAAVSRWFAAARREAA